MKRSESAECVQVGKFMEGQVSWKCSFFFTLKGRGRLKQVNSYRVQVNSYRVQVNNDRVHVDSYR